MKKFLLSALIAGAAVTGAIALLKKHKACVSSQCGKVAIEGSKTHTRGCILCRFGKAK